MTAPTPVHTARTAVGEAVDVHGAPRVAYAVIAACTLATCAGLTLVATGHATVLGLWLAAAAGWAAPALVAWWTAHPHPVVSALAVITAPWAAVVALLPLIVAAGDQRVVLAFAIAALAAPAAAAVTEPAQIWKLLTRALAVLAPLTASLAVHAPPIPVAAVAVVIGWAISASSLPAPAKGTPWLAK